MSASCTSSSSGIEKSVYFRVISVLHILDDTGGEYSWYLAVDDNGKDDGLLDNKKRVLSPVTPPQPQPGTADASGCVALDSIIYVFGGIVVNSDKGPLVPYVKHSLPDMFYFDTQHPDGGWKTGPSMTTGRELPYSTSINGKIYVMGGQEEGESWIEVFDPSLNEWKSLWTPPVEDCGLDSEIDATDIVVVDDGYKLRPELPYPPYPAETGPLYCYESEATKCYGSWTDLAAVVDGTVYWFRVGQYGLSRGKNILFAFELAENKWNPKQVRGLDGTEVLPPVCRAHTIAGYLFYIGNGKLCLIWSEKQNAVELLRVHYSEFTISKQREENGDVAFNALVESSRDYFVDGDVVADCLVV